MRLPEIHSITELQIYAAAYYRNAEHLPIAIRRLAEEAARRHITGLSAEIGALELAYTRGERIAQREGEEQPADAD